MVRGALGLLLSALAVAVVAPLAIAQESATTASSSSFDTNASNNLSTVKRTATESADLILTKIGPSNAVAGTNVTYTITLTNAGPSDAAELHLTDVMPADLTLLSFTQTSGPSFSCGAGNTSAGCTISLFPVNAVATFSTVAQVKPSALNGNSPSNTVFVVSITPDPNGLAVASASTTISTSADVGVAKNGPAAVAPGTDITYTATVSNAGPSDAGNVQLTDALPPGTTFASGSQTNGPAFNCVYPAPDATGTILCSIPSLSAGATASFSFTFHVLPTATGVISNTAVVSSTTSDPAPGNGSASSAAVVSPAPTDLSITKTANDTRFQSGAQVTYTIVAANNGPAVATNVVVTDVLPAATTFVSATPTRGSCTGTPTVTCNAGVLLAGDSVTITLIVALRTTIGTVSNTANVTSDNADTAPANNAATLEVVVLQPISSLSSNGLLTLAIALAVASLMIMRR